jgi:hypothetical protein
MTNIYTYCLFDRNDVFYGVYSSIKAVYRDAIKISNKDQTKVYMKTEDGWIDPSLKMLRNMLKGKCDVMVLFQAGSSGAKILKTKLKE